MPIENCLLLLGFLLLPLCLLSGPAMAADPAYITAAGQGMVSAPPDTVTINAGVTNSARTAREALAANSQIMTQVFAAMRTMNIPDRDIRTTNLNLQPQYGPAPAGTIVNLNDRPVTGYRATNNVSITIEDVAKAGPALDALVAAGANQSGGLSYSIRNNQRLLDQARTDAVKDAMARAKVYAAAAGVSLGALHAITDTAPAPVVNLQGFTQPAPLGALPAPPPPIGIGEQTLRVNITMSWEIK